MKHAAPISLATISLFQALASWFVIQMVQHQSEHHDKLIIQAYPLYAILLSGVACVLTCVALEIRGNQVKRPRQFMDLGVIAFAVYSIPASVILFYTIKPWLRQILYL